MRNPLSGVLVRRPSSAYAALVPLTALAAGLLFALSASTAQGTDLRAGRRSQLVELVRDEVEQVDARERAAAALRQEVSAAADAAAAGDSRVAAERAGATALQVSAGLTAVRGPALTVVLDDAPRTETGQLPASDNPDDLVVHQQDLQAVVNAMWAGGAEAMTLMGQRIISTSAVRCVGNTVILHGRVYGPPFTVTAVGDVTGMRDALEVEPGVAYFRTFVERFGLGYSVRSEADKRLPAYDGPLELSSVARARP